MHLGLAKFPNDEEADLFTSGHVGTGHDSYPLLGVFANMVILSLAHIGTVWLHAKKQPGLSTIKDVI